MRERKIFLTGFGKLYADVLAMEIAIKSSAQVNILNEMNKHEIGTDDLIIIQLNGEFSLRSESALCGIKDQKKIAYLNGSPCSDKLVFEMMNSGIRAIVRNTDDICELVRAIDSVYNEGYYLNDLISSAMLHYCKKSGALSRDAFGPGTLFNEREIRMIELRSLGKTAAEIGDELYLSKKTIDKIFCELYRRMECPNFPSLFRIYQDDKSRSVKAGVYFPDLNSLK
ncbi:MAG: DNA-binding response regulator [Bacteroidetes bacterium]|nr:MAG: DNA-binding response regulator [Bacteroidota bacterium]REK04932.1 MAG: DNA-binding response regulator [Bacteroidota bacterium]REK36564.1 MAG: DNA-binding response regulator [Bacteroidota bacterium]REK50930.1 MAG: DNA-binding response regulator [Bacteroidota bacterium]